MRYLGIPLACAALAGCAGEPRREPRVGMPNPASEYCVKQGGRLEIRKGEQGEAGYCHLPDGRIVEEWEFFRRSGAPGNE